MAWWYRATLTLARPWPPVCQPHPVYDRQRPDADADHRQHRSGRHRSDSAGAAGAVSSRCLPRADLHRHRGPGPAESRDRAERRELRHGDQRAQSGDAAETGHDGQRHRGSGTRGQHASRALVRGAVFTNAGVVRAARSAGPGAVDGRHVTPDGRGWRQRPQQSRPPTRRRVVARVGRPPSCRDTF